MNRTDATVMPISPLGREALDWVVRLNSGDATRQDASDLAAWRARSAEHEAAFREAVRVRRGLQGLIEAREAEKVIVFPPRRATVSRRAFVAGGGALAASIVGGVMLARPPMDLWPSYAELMADYRTGPGERRKIREFAGVVIEMNTRTSLNKSHDGIDMIVGEAFVTVERDTPFRIAAGSGAAEARRAVLNFRHIDGEVCVTCVEGRVSVASGSREANLDAGRQLVYSANGFGAVEATDLASATAWRSGQLIFNSQPLGKVVAEVNRYRAGRIVLGSSGLARQPVSAVFHIDQIANAVTQIEQLAGVQGTHLPGGIVVIG